MGALRIAVAVAAVMVTSAARGDVKAHLKLARDLEISGGVLLGAGFVFGVGTSVVIGLSCPVEPGDALCQHDRWAWGWLPLAGPWVQLGYDHDFSSTVALFTVPAIVQLVGAGLVVAGIVVKARAR